MLNRLIDWTLAALVMGALACAGASPVPTAQCDTDTDCTMRFGGDGGPEPVDACYDPTFDGYDCGEGR